jgi:hypothetical protein
MYLEKARAYSLYKFHLGNLYSLMQRLLIVGKNHQSINKCSINKNLDKQKNPSVQTGSDNVDVVYHLPKNKISVCIIQTNIKRR